MIDFHPITLDDRERIREIVTPTCCRNCDLNFLNLYSWRKYYHTEVAFHQDWLLVRFKANGKTAYLSPTGKGDWEAILSAMVADAKERGEEFLMLGCTDYSLELISHHLPGRFVSMVDRSYTDYIYLRERLSSLSGKALQSKRNHCNKFRKLYPQYEYLPLTVDLISECRRLDRQWSQTHTDEDNARLTPEDETTSMDEVFDHWSDLDAQGGVIRVDGKIIAFTYGAPVNHDTFDSCVEKADISYEGAYAIINQEFALHLPEQYIYINREEDLGIEGLRRAKLSYKPELLLHKNTVREHAAVHAIQNIHIPETT